MKDENIYLIFYFLLLEILINNNLICLIKSLEAMSAFKVEIVLSSFSCSAVLFFKFHMVCLLACETYECHDRDSFCMAGNS